MSELTCLWDSSATNIMIKKNISITLRQKYAIIMFIVVNMLERTAEQTMSKFNFACQNFQVEISSHTHFTLTIIKFNKG